VTRKALEDIRVTPEFVVGFARQSIEMALTIALPMLSIGLIVGIFVSVLQAATQIQEMTLTFIPKIVSIFLALLFAFPWIMDKMVSFTREVFLNLPNYIR
jgi:flagellar biosynthetic protein FliQ